MINIKKLHSYLSTSYWSEGFPLDVLKKSLQNSINFSVISPEDKFIGFGRLITDKATFAYLADVYIDNRYRGIGLGKFLIQNIMNYSDVQGIRTWLLLTKDAHDLYNKFGWDKLDEPDIVMSIRHQAKILYNTDH